MQYDQEIKFGSGKFTFGGAAFALLTVGIFWYQFYQIQPGDMVPQWNRLKWGYVLLMVLFVPVETLASGCRIWIVCRTVYLSAMSGFTCLLYAVLHDWKKVRERYWSPR